VDELERLIKIRVSSPIFIDLNQQNQINTIKYLVCYEMNFVKFISRGGDSLTKKFFSQPTIRAI
jgi:hypothetical protein